MSSNSTPPDSSNQPPQGEGGKTRPPNTATRLASLVEGAGVELFRDRRRTAFAAIEVGGHRENLALQSWAFKQWLARQARQVYGSIPGTSAIEEAVNSLVADARFGDVEREVHVRVAGHGGAIYLDLGDRAWRAVEVRPDGWDIVERCPVSFWRPEGMQPLPEPYRAGASLGELQQLLNLSDCANWMRVVAWLLAVLRPEGPYPLLVLGGEQGSAKSTASEILRSLVDPYFALLAAPPRSEQDVAVTAENCRVLAYDNLSAVPAWLSDALCRVSTGAGFVTRRLYSDREVSLIAVARPVLVNGISPDMVSRPDLLDRALIVELPAIPDSRRRTKVEVMAELEAARPGILAALLDAVAAGLRNLPATRLEALPRMADLITWVEACCPALGWAPGAFVGMYQEARQEADQQALELWEVWPVLWALLQKRSALEGTMGQVLNLLNAEAQRLEPNWRPSYEWPRNAKGLGMQLQRYAPNLRRRGVEYVRGARGSNGYRIRIARLPGPESAAA